MASFYIPLSGLNADSTALNTIANDLSNMNTTGFKAQTANFSDLFYQQLGTTGSGDPIQAGAGTQVANIETDFAATTSNSTGLDSDVALQGSGFFVVQNGSEQYFPRDGNFSTNNNGGLITADGLSVMGYPAVNGVVNTNAPLVPITIPENQTQAPSATTSFTMDATLNSGAAIGATASGPITIYDSLGNSYKATINYTKTNTNQWSYSISVPDNLTANTSTPGQISYTFGSSGGTQATVDPGTSLTITGPNNATPPVTTTITAPVVTAGEALGSPTTAGTYAYGLQQAITTAGINATVSVTGNTLTITGANLSTSGSVVQDAVATNATGTLNFDSNGNLVSPSTNVSGISFAGLSDGASSLGLTWDLYGSNNTSTITQVDATAVAGSTPATLSIANTSQNGFPSGEYTGFTIGSDGTVTATFSNDQKLNVGQIALGTVANLQGLKANGNGEYSTTLASGSATIGVSGSSGLGTMEDGALEASNVNISQEFSDLIIAQRAFEANSKAITTFDTVTQETIQMIH